jgi:hypothetical protein
MFGLHFGRFFHKLIWSPWPETTRAHGCQTDWVRSGCIEPNLGRCGPTKDEHPPRLVAAAVFSVGPPSMLRPLFPTTMLMMTAALQNDDHHRICPAATDTNWPRPPPPAAPHPFTFPGWFFGSRRPRAAKVMAAKWEKMEITFSRTMSEKKLFVSGDKVEAQIGDELLIQINSVIFAFPLTRDLFRKIVRWD